MTPIVAPTRGAGRPDSSCGPTVACGSWPVTARRGMTRVATNREAALTLTITRSIPTTRARTACCTVAGSQRSRTRPVAVTHVVVSGPGRRRDGEVGCLVEHEEGGRGGRPGRPEAVGRNGSLVVPMGPRDRHRLDVAGPDDLGPVDGAVADHDDDGVAEAWQAPGKDRRHDADGHDGDMDAERPPGGRAVAELVDRDSLGLEDEVGEQVEEEQPRQGEDRVGGHRAGLATAARWPPR
jgi:hypothetical protein